MDSRELPLVIQGFIIYNTIRMSIPYLGDKIKREGALDKSLIFQVCIVILVALGSFFLGRISISTQEHEKVHIVNNIGQGTEEVKYIASSQTPKSVSASNTNSSSSSRVYVASKNGKLYYRIGCGASSRILESNQVFFQTEMQARDAGFSPSASCTP